VEFRKNRQTAGWGKIKKQDGEPKDMLWHALNCRIFCTFEIAGHLFSEIAIDEARTDVL
jgi:hypothetical protein